MGQGGEQLLQAEGRSDGDHQCLSAVDEGKGFRFMAKAGEPLRLDRRWRYDRETTFNSLSCELTGENERLATGRRNCSNGSAQVAIPGLKSAGFCRIQ